MTSEEQMRIVTNWTYMFRVGSSVSKQPYGRLIFTRHAMREYIGPYSTSEEVIDVAYTVVLETVWRVVESCG